MSTYYPASAEASDVMPESEQVDLRNRILNLQTQLSENYVGKEHIAHLIVVSAIAGEPLLMVGAPGAGKSAMVKRFARLVDVPAWAFLDYVITPETSASELYTLPSPDAPSGQTGGTALMNAQIVFLDEVFQARSSILNPLLRRLSPWETPAGIADSAGQGRFSLVVAATRSLEDPAPNESLLDRFTLQVNCNTVNQDSFSDVIRAGTRSDMEARKPIFLDEDERCTVFDLVAANNCVASRLDAVTRMAGAQVAGAEVVEKQSTEANSAKGESSSVVATDFAKLKGFEDFERLIRRLEREDRVFISDRKLIKLYKLLTTVAWLRDEEDLSPQTLQLLSYIGNTTDEMHILAEKVPLLIEQL